MQLRATRLTAIASAVKRAIQVFSPAQLFGTGAPGVWYDPSDLTTLFQDSTGTTPVTAVEQPVGLMLDKSQGLVLGPELVTNGDFSNGTTGWIITGASVSISGGVCSFATSSANDRIAQVFAYEANKRYRVTFTITSYTAGQVKIVMGNGAIYESPLFSTTGTFSAYVLSDGSRFDIRAGVNGTTLNIDNISVRELPGNHAFQSTSASRPVLSARYNLLTKTEQFNDAAWVKDGATISANAVTAPDGTLTADKLVESDTTAQHRCYYQISLGVQADYFDSIYLKKGERDWAYVYFGSQRWAYFNLNAGATGTKAAGTTSSITSVGDGWYLCSVVGNSTATLQYFIVNSAPSDLGVSAPSYTGDGTSGIYIWGASLVPANQSTLPYQRVNTSTDYATVGFLPYLKFDGVDDSLSTNSINFTSTDKMSVFTGARKLSDVSFQCFVSSGTPTTENQRFAIFSAYNNAAKYAYQLSGSSFSTLGVAQTANNFTAPVSNVVSSLMEISTTPITAAITSRANAASQTLNQLAAYATATTTFANSPLVIGQRADANFRFNGQMYSLIIVGKAVNEFELASTEYYLNEQTGAY